MTIDEIYEGQKVIIRGRRGRINWDPEGIMERYIEKEVTVLRKTTTLNGKPGFKIKEDQNWVWDAADADPAEVLVEPTDEELMSVLFV